MIGEIKSRTGNALRNPGDETGYTSVRSELTLHSRLVYNVMQYKCKMYNAGNIILNQQVFCIKCKTLIYDAPYTDRYLYWHKFVSDDLERIYCLVCWKNFQDYLEKCEAEWFEN